MSLNRKKPLARGGRVKSSGKPMRKRGATKAKKEKRYKSFLSSAAWKRIRREALEDAGYRCQNREGMGYWWDGPSMTGGRFQCDATENLTVHHLTYARFGGNERPEDLQVLCRSCHNYVSALEGRRVS